MICFVSLEYKSWQILDDVLDIADAMLPGN